MINLNTVMSNQIHTKSSHVFNLLTLVVKQALFSLKCAGHKPTITVMHNRIELIQRIEFENAIYENNTQKTANRWSPVIQKLEQVK